MKAALCIVLLSAAWQHVLADVGRDPTRLNISIAIFDPGIPADRSLHRKLQVFPRVREIEALYLPFVLHDMLVSARVGGAVRVIPESDPAAELLVSGTILNSDGETLQLRLQVTDASGTVWLNEIFSGPQQDLFAEFGASLIAARSSRDMPSLNTVIEVSLLRYGQQLAPAAFDGYLESTADGTLRIRRLPAKSDPMLARIERIRDVEYVFTDAIDAKFRELSADIEVVYKVWREYRQKFSRYQAQEAERIANAQSTAPPGSFEAISSHYENYKWDRQAVQEQEKWAAGFENEMAPTINAIEARVFELKGWVADRYDEWRRILGQMFELETELPD
ncbi:MAG: hypothetical protein O2907_00895 [Proteobacteria bacterium]|nr:hypothetical protein [Pseudomonadota bacterium]MDA1062887.1 hypothetical protein [Pseudomonadota bacterium]